MSLSRDVVLKLIGDADSAKRALNEAANAPGWSIVVFLVSGVVALIGVFGLAKFHPQNR